MGYEGAKLADLFSEEAIEATKRTARELADKGTDYMLDKAKELTPSRTGKSRSEWRRSDIKRRRSGKFDAYRGDIKNDWYVTRFISEGTRPHTITPKHAAALELPDGTERESVEVSGIKARHIPENAAALTEVGSEEFGRETAEKWKQDVEEIAKRHKGIE